MHHHVVDSGDHGGPSPHPERESGAFQGTCESELAADDAGG